MTGPISRLRGQADQNYRSVFMSPVEDNLFFVRRNIECAHGRQIARRRQASRAHRCEVQQPEVSGGCGAKKRRQGTADQAGFTWYPNLSESGNWRLIALSDALDDLFRADPRKAKMVDLQYFGGLSVEETAAVLKVPAETITRDWRLARGWLLLQIVRAKSIFRARLNPGA